MDEQHAEHGDVFAERRDKLAALARDRRRLSHQVPAARRDRVAARRLRVSRGGAGLAGRAPRRRPRRRAPRARQAHLRRRQGPERRAAALLPARRARRGALRGARARRPRRLRRRRGHDDAHPARRAQPAHHLVAAAQQVAAPACPRSTTGSPDVETRYRKRYLDLAANDDSRDVFVKRARIIAAIRRFLDDRGFIEVETPVLQPLYGGALAQARSSRTTTSSSATSTCASPPSCTSSAASSAASTASTRSARTSATRA